MADKAIFLDRDDTLIEDPGYINHPDQVKLIKGVARALIEFRELGYRLIVVSNQSGIARGIVSEEGLVQIHDRLKELLAKEGAFLDQIYYCPFHPDGVIDKYRQESELRKPRPGMLITAAQEMDLDLAQSWMIGNSDRDVIAGSQAGCTTILIHPPHHRATLRPHQSKPDYEGVNIKEAVNIIKKHHRSTRDKSEQEPPDDTAASEIEQAAQPAPQQQAIEAQPVASESQAADESTQQILSQILEQLKCTHRDRLYSEFSALRLMAGVLQIIAAACLIVSISLLLRPVRTDSLVFMALGFGVLLQLMALTFYMIDRRK